MRSFLIFRRTGNDVPEIFVECLSTNFLKLACNFAHQPRKISRTRNRENAETGANLRGPEIDRADRPRFGEHVRERRTERGSAGVSGFQFIETARKIAGEPGFVDAKLFEDAWQIAIRDIEELEEEMFDLDVIMSARQAETRRGFESVPSGIVEFSDQTF